MPACSPRRHWISHSTAWFCAWNVAGTLPSGQPHKLRPAGEGFDLKAIMDDPEVTTKISIGDGGFDLEPKTFGLGFTQQRIYLPNRSRLAARVEGKSSLARLGVGVHVTARRSMRDSVTTQKPPKTSAYRSSSKSSTSAARRSSWTSACPSAN